MNKYKVNDRFIVRIDKLLHGRNGYGEFTDYILNAEPQVGNKIVPKDGCVVTEKFLDQCSPFDLITNHEIIETERMKPCPFCGCKMKLRHCMMSDGRTVRYEPYGHHNHGCQLRFFSTVGNPTTIEGAIRKWNRRAEDDKQV